MTEEKKVSLTNVMSSDPDMRQKVVADCVLVLDAEVAKKKGVSGLLVKGGFKVVKALKGGKMIEELVDWLLDEFMDALDPYYQEFSAKDEATRGTFYDFLTGQTDEAAESLLSVTDRRRERAKNKILIKSYDRMRPTAVKHVQEGIPAVAELIQKYAF